MATLKQVAAAAGVHPVTAAVVLNRAAGNTRVSEATRQRVEQVAREMGYRVNEQARSLRTRETRTVGFVEGDIRNPFFASLATHLEQHLQRHAYRLLLSETDSETNGEAGSAVETLLRQNVDALLIWSEGDSAYTDLLADEQRPVIWLGQPTGGKFRITIPVDEVLTLAVDHLRGSGAKRIGFYTPSAEHDRSAIESRAAILRNILKKRRLPSPQVLVYPGASWDIEAASRHAATALAEARERQVDAMIAFNDVAALGWLMGSRESTTLPMVGFDGTDWIRAWRPAVPYVDLRIDELAAQAAELLMHALSKPRARAKQIITAPQLVASQS